MKTLECSGKGDKRFCTFYAFVDFDGKYKSIEAHLQDCKRNEQGYFFAHTAKNQPRYCSR